MPRDVTRRKGFITHRKVSCPGCSKPVTIPVRFVGNIPCSGCNNNFRPGRP
jgi:hypothetical protein